VDPHAVVSDFDVLEDLLAGFLPVSKGRLVEKFIFESAPERFDGGVIVAISFAAHAGLDTGRFELGLIFGAGVLATPIGMMQEALRRKRLSMFESHLEGLESEAGLQILLHGPADDFAAVEIHDRCQVEPAFPGGNIGNVADPNLIHAGGCGPARQTIGGDWMIMVALGGADAKATPAPGDQALFAHEPFDPFVITMVAAFFEHVSQAWAAVGALELNKNAFKE